MKRRYQVFISSTYLDLVDERERIIRALLECDCFPAGMEMFLADAEKSWNVIKNWIDESDFYLLVIAGRYGSINESDPHKRSFTEMEFDYAVSQHKPILAFVHDNVDAIPSGEVDSGKMKKKLDDFRKRVQAHNNVAYWHDKGTLISVIKTSIERLKTEKVASGWIRSTDFIQENIINDITTWKMSKIFNTRAEKNAESDPMLETYNIKKLDGIAFGLRSFRSRRKNDVLQCLNNGMNVRLLVMNPDGEFAIQRAVEEHVPDDSVANSIKDLVEWSKKLNSESNGGKIELKFYKSMTLDFYWRIDDIIYTGPYMYNLDSQQTITFKYLEGGKGFKMYSEYFEDLWNNTELCIPVIGE